MKVHIDPGYLPFITEGFVSMLGSKNLVPVKILRDTGASESFVLESVLPFSAETDSGNSVLIRGIGLNNLSVPLHKLILDCGLVKGDVVVGVRPSLPIEGIDVILGNNLAGERVWPVVFPSLVVSTKPSIVGIPDESAQSFPAVFSAGAVTRSMSHGDPVPAPVNENTTKKSLTVFPVIPLSVFRSDLINAPRTDPTLEELRDQIVPVEQLGDVAHGYFLQEDVLMRKWESTEDGKTVRLADTVTSLGSCNTRSVHEDENVPGPDDCILQGRLKNSETLDILDSPFTQLPVDGRKELVGLIRKIPGLFSVTPTRCDGPECF